MRRREQEASVGQVGVDVDLLLDPRREVRHVAVHAGPEHLTEAHAAPRRQAEQRPATAAVLLLLAHQRAAAVALNTHTHTHISTMMRSPSGLNTRSTSFYHYYKRERERVRTKVST